MISSSYWMRMATANRGKKRRAMTDVELQSGAKSTEVDTDSCLLNIFKYYSILFKHVIIVFGMRAHMHTSFMQCILVGINLRPLLLRKTGGSPHRCRTVDHLDHTSRNEGELVHSLCICRTPYVQGIQIALGFLLLRVAFWASWHESPVRFHSAILQFGKMHVAILCNFPVLRDISFGLRSYDRGGVRLR